MLSAFARAIETLFGPALQPTASLLRLTATLALIGLLTASAWVAVHALTAWRFGWTTVPAVICPRCGTLVLDRSVPTCPEGHPVRFPPAALPLEESARSRRRARAAYPVLLSGAIGALAVLGYRATGLERLTRPLSTISAAIGYLFLAAVLFSVAFAISPGGRGAGNRLAHLALAFACALPALSLLLFARALEPAKEREIGVLWTTPSSLYVGRTRRRAVNCGPVAQRLEARLVETRLPGFGVVWQGLRGFFTDGREVAWRGSGGLTARLLQPIAEPAERGGFVTLSRQSITLEANRRLAILSSGEHVRFVPSE